MADLRIPSVAAPVRGTAWETARPWRWPALLAALLLGALALRLALLPLTEGADFHAFTRLAWLTLHGQDVYALGRAQLKTSPWTYFPLCLDLFTALQWLSVHTGWSFRVLGKLPIVAADLAIGCLLYRALRRRGQTPRVATLGMALYLFNPLVLYNGAFYGRFDAVALVFLLLALEAYRTRLFAPAYALAVAAKLFPLFLLPLLALGRDRQTPRRLLAAGALVAVLALPYLVTDPTGLLYRLLYHMRGAALGRLSWYTFPIDRHWLAPAALAAVAHVGVLLYPVLLLAVAHRPLYVKAAVCLALFVVVTPAVYEQYLTWAMPFLLLVGLVERDRLALALYGLLTIAGMLENEQTWDPGGFWHYALAPTPWPPLSMALALLIVAFVVSQALRRRAGRVAPSRPGPRWRLRLPSKATRLTAPLARRHEDAPGAGR